MGRGAGGMAVGWRLFGYVHGEDGRTVVCFRRFDPPAREEGCFLFSPSRGRFSFSSSLVFSFVRIECADPSFDENDTGRSRFFRYVASFRFDDEERARGEFRPDEGSGGVMFFVRLPTFSPRPVWYPDPSIRTVVLSSEHDPGHNRRRRVDVVVRPRGRKFLLLVRNKGQLPAGHDDVLR